jgi:hypothetical protein
MLSHYTCRGCKQDCGCTVLQALARETRWGFCTPQTSQTSRLYKRDRITQEEPTHQDPYITDSSPINLGQGTCRLAAGPLHNDMKLSPNISLELCGNSMVE